MDMARGGGLTWWFGLTDPSVERVSDTESETADTATGAEKEGSKGSQTPKDPDNMTYQCDNDLGGAPNPTDCEKLSWSGLKPPDSVETLEANVPKFYSQGVCPFSFTSFPDEDVSSNAAMRSNLTLYPLRHLRSWNLICLSYNYHLGSSARSVRYPLQLLCAKPHRKRQGRSRVLWETSPQLLDQWQAGLSWWCQWLGSFAGRDQCDYFQA